MPNWCFNTIEIEGPWESIKRLDDQFKGRYLSIVEDRMPTEEVEEIIKHLHHQYIVEPDESGDHSTIYYQAFKEGYSFENIVPMPFEECMYWYNWRHNNWGVRWDFDEDSFYKNVIYREDYKNSNLTYKMSTPGSAPNELVKNMSKQYPSCTIKVLYEGEEMLLAGFEVYKAGHLMEKKESEESTIGYRSFLECEFEREFAGYCPKCACPIEQYELDDADGEAFECPNEGCLVDLRADKEGNVLLEE